MEKSSRSRNSVRNLVWGGINKGLILIFQFIIRSVIIQKLGAEYLGLNSLFTSILQILSLSELGFGSAVVYSLYRPVAERDVTRICALMNLYKKIYRVVGIVILGLGLVLMPFLPDLIEGGYPPEINIYVIYLMQLLNVAITYFLFAYKNVLFIAHQRTDANTKINTVALILQYVLQLVSLIVFRNYYAFVVAVFISTVINNLLVAIFVRKMYPEYIACGEVNNETKRKIGKSVRGLFVSKVCQTTRNSLDSIVLSMFMGLDTVAIYNNYYSVLNALLSVAKIITTSILSSIGNSMVTERVEKNYDDMRKFNFMFMLLVGWASILLLNLYQPFMVLWMGEEYLFDFGIVLLFVLYFYALGMGVIRGVYSDAAGLWWENRYRAVAETAANLVLNLILGKVWGVTGIIVATLFSLLVINFGMGSQILFKFYFKEQRVAEYFKDHLVYFIVTVMVAIATYGLCSLINGEAWLVLFARMAVCVVSPALLYFAFYGRTKMFGESKRFVKKMMRFLRKK